MAAKNPKFFILISQTIHHPKYQKKRHRDSWSDYVLFQLQNPSNWLRNSSVHLILSHGSAEAGRKNGSTISLWVCMCVRERWERREKLCLRGPVTAAGTSVQYQWQLAACNMRTGGCSEPPLGGSAPLPLLVLFSPPIIHFQCLFSS